MKVETKHADKVPLVNLNSQLVPANQEELVTLVLVDVEKLPWLVYNISTEQPLVWGEWRMPAKGAATTWAEQALSKLGVQATLHPRLASNSVDGRRTKVLYVAIQQRAMLEGSMIETKEERWRPWQQLKQRGVWEVASLAVAAQQQRSANTQVLIPLEVQIRAAAGDGVMPRSRIFRKEIAASTSHPKWHDALTKVEVAQVRMRKRLSSVPLDDPQAEWCHKCADAMRPIPLKEIPVDLRRALPDFADERLATLEFPRKPVMPKTDWVKKPTFRKIPKELWPKAYRDFWKPEAWPKVLKALNKLRHSLAQGIHMEEKFAFDEAWYEPELRGTPWTYAGAKPEEVTCGDGG
jgi:hypothetical protein